jgi:RHH-type transcriptional regulator, proline utilization regulon repressor / proline dehydrogenase / delta 1-pyrroline-5-carboxylate dehydrogenase
MALRVQATDELSDLFMILSAADIVGTRITLSIAPEDYKLEVLKNCINKECDILIQSEAEFLEEMDDYERIRTCSPDFSKEMILKAAQLGKYIATAKPIIEGRVELLHYVKEQSIAFEYHRYGSITETPETEN